jgi:predicted DCC family thiol-disulfide oxidoreductase YuxK
LIQSRPAAKEPALAAPRRGGVIRDLLPTIPREPFSYRRDGAVPPFPDDRPLVVFDGYCGLCSRLVQFTLRHDPGAIHRFVPAQSGVGDALFRHYGLNADDYETFILIRDGKGFFVSDAVVELLRPLGFPWSLAPAIRVFPRQLRDRVYLWVARNRMHFFGRTEACYLPDASTSSRFVDGGGPAHERGNGAQKA